MYSKNVLLLTYIASLIQSKLVVLHRFLNGMNDCMIEDFCLINRIHKLSSIHASV